jgi:hypothetical protein
VGWAILLASSVEPMMARMVGSPLVGIENASGEHLSVNISGHIRPQMEVIE